MATQNSRPQVFLIPKKFSSPKQLEEVTKRYKKLRLHGLKVDPKSFSSTYEEESRFPAHIWRSRIQNPLGKTFVSIADAGPNHHPETSLDSTSSTEHSDNMSLSDLLHKKWTGIVTLLGPAPYPPSPGRTSEGVTTKPWDAFIKNRRYTPHPISKSEDLKGHHVVYGVVGMFVLPDERRKGYASALIEAVFQSIHKGAAEIGAAKTSITIQVEHGNENALRLYERLGFKVWEEALLMENRQGDWSYAYSLVKEVDL